VFYLNALYRAVKIDTKDVMTFSFGYGYDGEDNYMNDPF